MMFNEYLLLAMVTGNDATVAVCFQLGLTQESTFGLFDCGSPWPRFKMRIALAEGAGLQYLCAFSVFGGRSRCREWVPIRAGIQLDSDWTGRTQCHIPPAGVTHVLVP